MGIKGLMKFISDNASGAVREQTFSSFTGRILAIDASMSLYQFMIAIRDGDGFNNLVNSEGETTSHISGMLSRIIRLLEHGIKPVYVFDGKPPTMKSGELAKRSDKRAKAEEDLAAATEAGVVEDMKKFAGRTVKVTRQHSEDVKTLLGLLGIPFLSAPSEAEAQCAVLCAAGLAYGTGTEDADALTFGCPNLIRHLNFSEAKSKGSGVLEINLQTALDDLKLSMPQFIDFCILCGCDYCDSIKGIGPQKAYKLIQDHNTIEGAIKHIDLSKYPLPESFLENIQEARRLFTQPEVTPPSEITLKWEEPDEKALHEYLVVKNSFSESRFNSAMDRLRKSKSKSSQTRLETFFGAAAVKKAVKKETPKVKPGTGKRKSAVPPPSANKKAKA